MQHSGTQPEPLRPAVDGGGQLLSGPGLWPHLVSNMVTAPWAVHPITKSEKPRLSQWRGQLPCFPAALHFMGLIPSSPGRTPLQQLGNRDEGQRQLLAGPQESSRSEDRGWAFLCVYCMHQALHHKHTLECHLPVV